MSEATKPILTGAWRLVSFESRGGGGDITYPLGKDVLGQIMYGSEGRMAVLIIRADRPAFASGDMRRGTDAEVRSAFDGVIGYFGTYTIDAAAGTVTRQVIGAAFPNWMGGDQVRHYQLEGTRLTLSTPPFVYDGRLSESFLVWERLG